MSHIHWVAPQNKLEIPRDKDEVNHREIHECDGRVHDPDTMVAPLTPKPTCKVEPLSRTPLTIDSCREEDTELRKWSFPRYCNTTSILKLKQKSETPQWKPRSHVPTQISMRCATHPNHTPTHHTNSLVESARVSRPIDVCFLLWIYESIKRELKRRLL